MSIPRIGNNPEFLHTIPGVVPNLLHLPKGCPFSNRCEYVTDRCKEQLPELLQVGSEHSCRCFLASGEAAEQAENPKETEGSVRV